MCRWGVQDFPKIWPDTPQPDPPSAGPPLRRTAQNFALFSLSRTHFRFFSRLSLSGGLLVEFRLWGRDFTRQPENSKRAHFRAPALQKHHQNSTKGSQEREERKNIVAGEGKKNAEFWAPTLRDSTLRGPTFRGPTLRGRNLRAPTFSRFGPPP